MRSCWLPLLLLSAVTLDTCLSQSRERDTQDETRIIEAVKRFNVEENVLYLYKPLYDVPPVLLKEEKHSQSLGVMIQETVCPKSARGELALCDYKPDGDVKACTVRLAEKNADMIICSSLTKNSRRRYIGGGSVIGYYPSPKWL